LVISVRSELSLSDEWETPREMYNELCRWSGIYPELDVCANYTNSKCERWLEDALIEPWMIWSHTEDSGFMYERSVDIWCNPPHSKTEEFVKRAYDQHRKYNMNIIMIIPANSLCTFYAQCYIVSPKDVDYYPLSKRPRFLRDGKPSKYPSRNGYFVVIWRKK